MNEGAGKQEYISVGELSAGLSENALARTKALAGKDIKLFCESGKEALLSFINTEALKWTTKEEGRVAQFVCAYRAIMPRDEFYLVDFIVSYGDSESVSILLDMGRRIATVVTGILPTSGEVTIPLIVRAEKGMPLTAVNVSFEHAAVGEPFTAGTARHEKTGDLIGERFQWVYSSKDAYEHIYLNEKLYTWHCISGNEKGLADTDRCFYYKLGNDFYLFVWIEKIVPTMGLVLEDLAVMRSYGKIFGHEGYDMQGRITNFAVGSYGTRLNGTHYDVSRLRQ